MQTVVLGGMGGVGKTQLALQYAKKHADCYDSIFWLDASSKRSLTNCIRTFARRVNPGMIISSDGVKQLQHWLANPRNTRWLLIVDNMNHLDSFDIWDFIPRLSWGTVIVTSRRLNSFDEQLLHIKPLDNTRTCVEIPKSRSGRDWQESGESIVTSCVTSLMNSRHECTTSCAKIWRTSFSTRCSRNVFGE